MRKRRSSKPIAPAMPNVFAAYDAMSAAGVLDCRETSTLKPQAESYAEKYPNDRWDLFEVLPKFRAWVCDPFVYINGSRYRFAVVDRTPYSGLGWVCLVYTRPLRGAMPEVTDESGGAFYEGADDHPEGAIEWAKKSALAVKVRAYDSTDWDERMARVYDLKKRSALPLGDPGVLDAPWKDVLISLGYTPDDAHALALRPTPKPLTPELPGKLAAIKVLWRRPGTLCLYGIPYLMREGQSPYDLWRAHEEWKAPPPGHYGSKRIDLSDWIWLGSPGWWGSYSKADHTAIKAWLDLPHVKPCIPGNPCEWSPLDEPGKESA